MTIFRSGSWMMGVAALAGMVLLPIADAAGLCEGLACLGMWVTGMFGTAGVCAAIGYRLFYLAASSRADLQRTRKQALGMAGIAAAGTLPIVFVICILATQLYPETVTTVALADYRYDAMILAGAGAVALTGQWGQTAARRGGRHMAWFLAPAALAVALPCLRLLVPV